MRTQNQNINCNRLHICYPMSQADDHAASAEGKHCTKCNNLKYENMCSACQQDKNHESNIDPVTPIKRIDISQRQKELLQAPKKIPEQEQYESGDEDELESNSQEDKCENCENCQKEQLVKKQEAEQEYSQENSKEYEAETNQIQFKPSSTPIIVTVAYRKPIIVRQISEVKIEEYQQLEEAQLKRNYSQFLQEKEDIQLQKGKCKLCRKRTGLLGISCRHCGFQYCNTHRLPQNHQCQVDFVGQFQEKRRELVLKSMPKHKGKISEI